MTAAVLTEPRRIEKPTSQPVQSPPTAAPKPERLVSLDAYRGFIMLAMASSGFGFFLTVKQHPEVLNQTWNLFGWQIDARPVWQFLAFQFSHVDWIGCGFWDLIQPSFMFMVGVAVPYSLASRRAKGESGPWVWAHVVWRAVFLVLLGVFLSSNSWQRTDWTFVNVLSQIGLGYVFLCLLAGRCVLPSARPVSRHLPAQVLTDSHINE